MYYGHAESKYLHILEKASDTELSKDIEPCVVCRGMAEEQRNVPESDWPPGRSVIDKSHGSDLTVVLRIRPHTSDMKNINNLTLQFTLRRQCQTQVLYSVSRCALEDTGLFSTDTWIKTWLVKEKRPKFPSNSTQVSA